MRLLDVRSDHEAEDISTGKEVLRSEIGHPAKTVMIVRNKTPDVSQFADRADGRATGFPNRLVIWVKDPRIFDQVQIDYFGPEDSNCAVVLDLEDRPVDLLTSSAGVLRIEQAFLKAESAA